MVLKLSAEDLEKLVDGERVEVYKNVFLEFSSDIKEKELAAVVRKVKAASPKKYTECPKCKGRMFINNSCCQKCEGTGRVLLRPAISVGDEVVINRFIMDPWGWVKHPKPVDSKQGTLSIPPGTRANVIDIVNENNHSRSDFVVDCIIGRTLYRLVVEGTYVDAPLED